MKENLEKGIVDFEFVLFVFFFDSVYVGKSFKVSFVNWYLKFFNERGNLLMLKILWNKVYLIVRKEM